MRVNPTNSENNFSVPKAGLVGALAGYAAAYAVPLTTDEHAMYFTKAVKDNIGAKVIEARRGEINAIAEELNASGIKPLVKDIFEKNKALLEKAPNEALNNLKQETGLTKGVKSTVKGLFKRVNNTGKMTEMTQNMVTSFAAKRHGRAALYYALLGGLIFMTGAIMKNAIDAFFPKKTASKHENDYKMTDLDYIINTADGPTQLYIHGFGAAAKNKPGN